MSSSSGEGYSIRCLTSAHDLRPFAALELLACENDGHRCYIEPPTLRVSLERRIARSARALHSELSDPHTDACFARLDNDERTVVGVAIWKRELRISLEDMMRGSSAFTDHDWPEEEDTEGVDEGFCWQYYAGSEAKRREAMSGKIGWIYLKSLFVHPDHVRRGIGSALVSDMLKSVDEIDSACVLEATAGAVRLYEKLGFVERYKCEVELTGEGVGVLVRPGMIREGRSTRDSRS